MIELHDSVKIVSATTPEARTYIGVVGDVAGTVGDQCWVCVGGSYHIWIDRDCLEIVEKGGWS